MKDAISANSNVDAFGNVGERMFLPRGSDSEFHFCCESVLRLLAEDFVVLDQLHVLTLLMYESMLIRNYKQAEFLRNVGTALLKSARAKRLFGSSLQEFSDVFQCAILDYIVAARRWSCDLFSPQNSKAQSPFINAALHEKYLDRIEAGKGRVNRYREKQAKKEHQREPDPRLDALFI